MFNLVLPSRWLCSRAACGSIDRLLSKMGEAGMLNELCKESFDAVIVGTGLTESILSAALALSGKKVLHLDHDDFYGSSEATLSLDQVGHDHQEHQEQQDKPVDDSIGDKVNSKCKVAQADLGQRDSKSLLDELVLEENKMACAEPKIEVLDQTLWNAALNDRMAKRSFNFDRSPRLVLCRGTTVDALLRSGAAKYIEFKALEDALMLDADGKVLRVPCSKAAVFKSKDLGMGEKRQLMRFLQYCMDDATSRAAKAADGFMQGGGDSESAVKYRNEVSLNQGRSLARPQNKAVGQNNFKDNADGADDMDFVGFLADKCALSPKLQNSVMYAVGLLPRKPGQGALSVEQGMLRVQRFLHGLGRFGKTAFLCPVYGISEIGQAFCRLSAVHGSVLILRHRLASARLIGGTQGDANKVESVQFSSGQSVKCSNLILGPSYRLRVPLQSRSSCRLKSRTIARLCLVANGPVVSFSPSSAWQDDQATSAALLRASAALTGQAPAKRSFPQLQRCALVIPPSNGPIGNHDSTVFVLQLDYGVAAAAFGYFCIQLSIECECEAEGNAILENAAADLLSRANVTMSHIYPKVVKEDQDKYEEQQQQQQQQQQVLVEERVKEESREDVSSPKSQQPQGELAYVWKMSFADELSEQSAAVSSTHNGTVHIVPRIGVGLDIQEYFATAERLFEQINPGMPFLPEEQERPESHRQPPQSAAAEHESDDLYMARLKIPQPVDLRWFKYLGGKTAKS